MYVRCCRGAAWTRRGRPAVGLLSLHGGMRLSAAMRCLQSCKRSPILTRMLSSICVQQNASGWGHWGATDALKRKVVTPAFVANDLPEARSFLAYTR